MIARSQILSSHEPRSVTIIRHVTDYLLSTSVSRAAYADDVKNLYHQRIPNPAARCVRFHEGGDAIKDLKANDQLVQRFLQQDVKFPADIEEAFVLALPPQRRRRCLADLMARYELLAAPIPKATTEDASESLSRLLDSTGAVIRAIAPMMADGVVDERDAPHAKKALRTIHSAQAELTGWAQRITDALPDTEGKAHADTHD